MTKKIVLTGGGTTGHVSVNLALIPRLLKDGWEVHYMGSRYGIEKTLIQDIDKVTYHEISTGKLRRFKSFENFTDIFKVIKGTLQSIVKISKIKPDVTFSKGGYVSVPVLVGSWVNRVPSITHESDLTPGLANKLAQPFVKTIFTTFPETTDYISSGKGLFLGPVIRESLKDGNKARALQWLGIDNDKPILLVMGGSLGAEYINDLIRDNIDILVEKFNVVHATGKDGYDPKVQKDGYFQFEYIRDELKDILEAADVVLSRSGANAIFEFLYYKIPMLLIPLPTTQSRGDQIDNAKSFEKLGYALMIEEENASLDKILAALDILYEDKERFKKNMESFEFSDTIGVIYDKINQIKK